MVAQRHPEVIEDEVSMRVPEVPSLIIKTASVSLTNKEEQLSATPLQDKDDQVGT